MCMRGVSVVYGSAACAVAGLTFWSVTVGFPGGMLFRILWVLNDEAWHWDPSSSIHPRFVTRFLVPFIILPGAVTLLLVPKFRTLLVRP